MHHYETAQDAQYEALAAQVDHSSLLHASVAFRQSRCVLLLCHACCYTHCCASCKRISPLHGLQSRGEAYLMPTWLVHEQRLAQLQFNERIIQISLLLGYLQRRVQLLHNFSCCGTFACCPKQKVHSDLTGNREHAPHPECSTEHAEEESRNQFRTCTTSSVITTTVCTRINSKCKMPAEQSQLNMPNLLYNPVAIIS